MILLNHYSILKNLDGVLKNFNFKNLNNLPTLLFKNNLKSINLNQIVKNILHWEMKNILIILPIKQKFKQENLRVLVKTIML